MKCNKVLSLLNITRQTLCRYVKNNTIKVNELNDVCYFNYSEPIDRGQVFCPNGRDFTKNHVLRIILLKNDNES